jgi:hypothetical protein
MVKMEVLGRAASTAPAVIPGRNGDLDVLRNCPGVPFAWRLLRRACRWLPTDHNPAGAISPSYVPASRGYLAGAAAVHEPFLFELRRRLHSRHVPPAGKGGSYLARYDPPTESGTPCRRSPRRLNSCPTRNPGEQDALSPRLFTSQDQGQSAGFSRAHSGRSARFGALLAPP